MEKDLFNPIKEYFEKQGYVCDGEVKDIDLYMEKNGETVAVELKVSIDFRAVQQAALRQKITDIVYIGTFTPSNMRSHAFKDKLYLLKRLGIGLVCVSKRGLGVSVVSEPVISELASFRKRNTGKRKLVSKEFNKRKTKTNVGGVKGTKLITSYREDALIVLDALAELGGEATTRDIKILSGIDKSTDILYANYYGWFENVKKGVYRLREAGYDALEEFEKELYLLKKQN